MIVHMVWPNCELHYGRTSNTPIDSFWVECTPAEVASQLVPRLSPPQLEHLHTLHRRQAEPDPSTFVLIAWDLSSIEPMEAYYPYGNLWNAYSPFRAIVPLHIHDLKELGGLNAIALLIGPQSRSDSAFTQRMRFHQSWYRANRLEVLYGTGPNAKSKSCYGNMLRSEDAERGANFLDPVITAAAMQRLENKDDGVIDRYRLLYNLLTSQTMCFNLFGRFVAEPNSALPLVRAMLPDAIERVTRVALEYAPQPAKEYLGDRTAFDAFIEYVQADGRLSFAGIETKLTEPFSPTDGKQPRHHRYQELTKQTNSPWPQEAWPAVADVRHNQLWRDHLLVYAMLTHPTSRYAAGRLLLVRHPQDVSCSAVVAKYQELLRPGEDSFVDCPLDGLIAAWMSATPSSHRDWRAWLDAFDERYLRLEKSKADWLRWKAWAAK